ncbi:hypothetical protein B7P43_G09329, partial [Cryptotermes secundus]
MSRSKSASCLGIYYQNVRGLRTKYVEFYDNVCSTDFDIICLTETWLNDSCYDCNIFPSRYTVYRSDRVSTSKARGGGVLTAIPSSLGSCRRRYDLELCSECVWVEIPTVDSHNLLIGNHYFSPDTPPGVIINYFQLLENKLDTNCFRVVLLGDFNVPGFNWIRGSPLPNCHYYAKLKGDAIYTSACLLGLRQYAVAVDNHNLLDLVFSNLTDLKPGPSYSDLVKPDPYHPPLIIDVHLPHITYNPDYKFSHRKFAAGNYTLLYNTLSACDWSGVYRATSADDAVASLNATVQAAMEEAIPRCPTRKSKFPFWYSSSLRYYIGKKNYFHRRFKKKQTDHYYDKFIFYRKLVKSAIKTDRLRWLKSIDNDLKTQPQHLWKYVSSFRKHTLGCIQLQVDGVHLDEPTAVADTFAKHFQSLYNTHCPTDPPPLSQPTEFLSLAPVSDA